MLQVGAVVARSALWREESRGCHWRGDHKGASDEFCAHDIWRRGEDGPRVERIAGSAPLEATTTA